MTLIIGLNLSDKIIIGADSRASDRRNNIKADNILKIAPLEEFTWHDPSGINKIGYVNIAEAGNVRLAKFVHRRIIEYSRVVMITPEIRTLYGALDEPWARRLANDWLDKYHTYEECCLIIGGMSPLRPKRVNKAKFDALIDSHQDFLGERYSEQINQLPEGIYVSDWMMPTVQGHFLDPENVSDGSDTILTSQFDSLVFCLQINTNPSFSVWKSYKAEWGEMIVRGDNVNQKDIPDSLLTQCEFTSNPSENHYGWMMANEINRFAQTIPSIGGSVISMAITKDSNKFLLNDLYTRFHNNQYEIKDSDAGWLPLISYLEYTHPSHYL